MIGIVNRFWKETIFFSSYLGVLLVCRATDISAKSYGNDAFSLLYGAKFLEARYPSPIYTLFGYGPANLPFGTDGGNLVLFLSVIPAFITSILVFLIVRKQTENKLAPFVGAAVVMGSYPLFSQAVITEVYCLLAMFIAFMCFFLIYDKPKWAVLFCGLALSTHYITGFVPYVAFIVADKGFRRYWYAPIVVFLTINISYAFLIPKFYWEPTTSMGSQYLLVFYQVIVALGAGSDWTQVFSGVWQTIRVVIISFGIALIPVLLSVRDLKKYSAYVFMVSFPLAFMLVGNWSFRFVQLVPFVPVVAIMAGLGIDRIRSRHLRFAVLPASLAMMVSMPIFFDVGNTVDESPTTARQMYTALEEVDDGSIVIGLKLYESRIGIISDTTGGHVATIVEYYNRETGSEIVPFMMNYSLNRESEWVEDGVLREKLELEGVIVPEFAWIPEKHIYGEGYMYEYMIGGIAEANPDRDVYYYMIVDLETERCELVKWDGTTQI